MKKAPSPLHQAARWALAFFSAAVSFYFLLIPAVKLTGELNDPTLRTGGISPEAWQLSRVLAPRYAAWARNRIAHENDPATVSGTEWPLFGSLFYLEGVQALQEAWLKDNKLSAVAPVVYSQDAIEAAADLITQPGQAKWVQRYWGANYLHHADLFYRYLLISGMTSYTRVTGNGRFLAPLRDQVESLSAELDATPRGLLDDYPGQCFPPDVISALGAIQRADGVLHTDHTAFLQRELRGFTGPMADPHGLPPFRTMADAGLRMEPSRGSGDSFNLATTPALWPGQNAIWYKSYVAQFWQESHGLVGFREFAKDTPERQQFADVDSGPVIGGYGVAASAFGVAAARAQGDLPHAAPLTAEMLASSCPLLDGSLLFPRLLSDAIDAPFTGEAGILYSLTRPVPPGALPATRVMTPFVWCVLIAYFGLGLFFLLPLLTLLREISRRRLDKNPSS
jgi:hypothetical protein